jgi:NADPH:quinone reductase-like Zn-dependent oxidoreductase
MIKQMGVDHVIDYITEDILENKDIYDIFFDVVGNQSIFKVKPTLRAGGIYVSTLPSFQTIVLAPLINLFSSKKLKIKFASSNSNDLAIIKEMAEHGALKPIVEKSYPIEQIKKAHLRNETGRVVGKIVLRGFSK